MVLNYVLEDILKGLDVKKLTVDNCDKLVKGCIEFFDSADYFKFSRLYRGYEDGAWSHAVLPLKLREISIGRDGLNVDFDRYSLTARLQKDQPKWFFGVDPDKAFFIRQMFDDVEGMDYLFIRPEIYK